MPVEPPESLNVIYFPQIGFLIAVPLEPGTNRSLWSGSEEEPWDRLFSTETAVYYKNPNMRAMDVHYGDIYTEICDREIELVHDLAQRVLEHADVLSRSSDLCGEIDCIVCFAQAAVEYKLCRPQMVEENIIKIKGGRHPLQELSVQSFVPNDAWLAGGDHIASRTRSETATSSQLEAPSMLVLTGPNFSGKSIYLKQVAIIVFLAQVGSFVPAESAQIGITDKILTRITTRESVSRSQSAFMIDLQQVSIALSLATPRSLLVIDEFGKGTNASDGAGLACALFSYLLNLEKQSPKVLAATHFHEIFEQGLLRPHPALSLAHMEICVDDTASACDDQITYLYNLREGRSTASFGTCCAAMNGMPSDIIRRAEELVLLQAKGVDMIAACTELSVDEKQEIQEAERIASKFSSHGLEGDPRAILAELLAEPRTIRSVSSSPSLLQSIFPSRLTPI